MHDLESHSIRNYANLYAIHHFHFMSVVCSKNVNKFHRFRDIITFAACIEKAFSMGRTVEITDHDLQFSIRK